MDLADTSVWWWVRRPVALEARQTFDADLLDGAIATCDMVRLELLYSSRNGEDFARLREELDALPTCPITESEWERALWVYQQLANQGGAHQRAVKHPDLLIAAAAESAGAVVLHYDEDYERISAITGQPTRWLAPPGTLA